MKSIKVVKKIEFQETATSKICILTDEQLGMQELKLEIEKISIGDKEKFFSYLSYTEKDERLLLTGISARGKLATKALCAKASVILGDGGKVRALRDLATVTRDRVCLC